MKPSRIVFGTAALGQRYGLERLEGARELSDDAVMRLIRHAVECGVKVFDTAPAYGAAEERLGKCLNPDEAEVWTKISLVESAIVKMELDASLTRLRRSRIDVVQWHNWTPQVGQSSAFRACWDTLRGDPRVGKLGATTYGHADAVAAVNSGLFQVVQVEYNVLNQGVVSAVSRVARERGVEIAVRSVLLQGALTDEGRQLPPLRTLRDGVARARARAAELDIPLETLATCAAFAQPIVSWVLLGFDRPSQVDVAMEAERRSPLLVNVDDLDLGECDAVDPRRW